MTIEEGSNANQAYLKERIAFWDDQLIKSETRDDECGASLICGRLEAYHELLDRAEAQQVTLAKQVSQTMETTHVSRGYATGLAFALEVTNFLFDLAVNNVTLFDSLTSRDWTDLYEAVRDVEGDMFAAVTLNSLRTLIEETKEA